MSADEFIRKRKNKTKIIRYVEYRYLRDKSYKRLGHLPSKVDGRPAPRLLTISHSSRSKVIFLCPIFPVSS